MRIDAAGILDCSDEDFGLLQVRGGRFMLALPDPTVPPPHVTLLGELDGPGHRPAAGLIDEDVSVLAMVRTGVQNGLFGHSVGVMG